ncbi:MAG: aspartate/tyrosine/aromatic aminotransferase [Gammaproteobacteria bacterium]|nr:aspartate/tyrosine/aromatic aminotransferase [Gammaproteobacteria bacterium]MDH3505640.1 aspartate/tyrosine/aromatic aminotransferase [Gammaproteobacteria bacterium]
MFEKLELLAPDAIIGIMALFREDQAPNKVDLSVGVYQDDTGNTPVMECVKRAERQIVDAQTTKTYVGIAGNMDFNRGMEKLLFGADHPVLAAGRVATVQSPGGSGGLCVAAHLLHRANPDARIWLSAPSWPNHLPLLGLAGLRLESYPYYDYDAHAVDFDAMMACFEKLDAGELVLIHGCCHNPCGADLSQVQWQALTDLCERRGVIPFIDLAYQGLAESLEADAYGVRLMAERLPEVVVVSSCSKNLGLYRERTGAVCVVSSSPEQSKATATNLANVARGIYSMPPDHGAAIAGQILNDEALTALWVEELDEVRRRINGLRDLIVAKLAERGAPRDFSFIANERGMFSFLGISKEQVIRLREEFHVYMLESSRINLAGINQANVDYVADSIVAVL